MRWWGKYRGVVTDNKDPEYRGRLRIKSPLPLPPSTDGTDNILDWALPAMLMVGIPNVGEFRIPEEGSNVWVEFEQGDISHPVWSGGWISAPGDETHAHPATTYLEETPPPGLWDSVTYGTTKREAPTNKTFSTKSGHLIELDDEEGQLKIRILDAAGQEILLRSEPGRERIQLKDKAGNHILMDGVARQIRLQDSAGSYILLDAASGNIIIHAMNDLLHQVGGEVRSNKV